MAEKMTIKKSLALRDLLMSKPMTYEQLCEEGGLTPQRAAYWRKTNAEFIRIAGWAPDKNGRLFVPVFFWGPGEDVPRPGRALTSAERMRALRQRRRLAAQNAQAETVVETQKPEPVVEKEATIGIGLDDLI